MDTDSYIWSIFAKMIFMNFFKILFISVASLCLCTCGNKDSKKQQTITLGVMSSMDYLPLAVAQREGYFAKHGIDIRLQKFLSANERDAALQSGVVDGTVTDYTSAALVKAGGFDLKIASKCQAPFLIMAGKESGVENLEGLKGKKIAVSQNTVIDFCVDMALASAGLTESDVEKVEINKIPLRMEMMRNNKIDATGLPDPLGLIAGSEGCKTLATMDEVGYTVTGIVFTQKAIDNKSAEIRKMYAAYNDGVAYLRAHSIEDIKDILVKEMGFPEALVMQAKTPVYTDAQAPTDSDKDVVAVVEWLSRKGLIAKDFNISDLIDPSLTNQ